LKILLTGANGFVGSHILDTLLERGHRVSVLLRKNADTTFIAHHLESSPEKLKNSKSSPSNPRLSIFRGSIDDPPSIEAGLEGVTHVIHCAGRTKACDVKEFYQTNQQGTRNVVDAVNTRNGQIQRLLHISSLAVTGPGTASAPATEASFPRPVSHYGKSKLAAENEVIQHCKTDWTMLRPPAVYGPRDRGFLPLFEAVNSHLLPRTNAGQSLSLVYVKDLAGAVGTVLLHPVASRRAYFAAAPEIVTARQMADEIARLLGTWTVPVPLPSLALWPLCLGQDILSRLTGQPRLLNLQKFAELRAPGWVCDSKRLRNEIGFTCGTALRRGLAETLTWYQTHHWL
jgi:nucleoside-diphosphate-sugar epimerase